MPEWSSFFGEPGDLGRTLRRRVVRRGGAPLLVLPDEAPAALETLRLYPAQRFAARGAKAALAVALRLRLPLPLASVHLPCDPCAPFVEFLAQIAGLPSGGLPVWGMLAGNPNTPGQRLIFLIFGRDLKPRAVVKAGCSPEARRLIAQELAVLRALPPGLAGAVPLLGEWKGGKGDSAPGEAFALPFVGGDSPPLSETAETAPLFDLLTNWLRHGSDLPLGSLSAWRAVCHWPSLPQPAIPLETIVRAPVSHGDLAPWNIKTVAGAWTVLDWERGTLQGVPGWDWFHFVIQPAVLAARLPVGAIAGKVERLLASIPFREYAALAKITGMERTLLLGYLAHYTGPGRQSEGTPALAELLKLLEQRWN